MKLLAWNIQQGGAKRARAIAEVIQRFDADILVLSELRHSSSELLLRLRDLGWRHQLTGLELDRVAAVGILSRHVLVPLAETSVARVFPGRWIEAWVPSLGLVVAGVYGPLQTDPYDDFWHAVREVVPSRCEGAYLLAGDLNTGQSMLDAPKRRFFCSDHFVALGDLGLVDLWRSRYPERREYSYHHRKGNGVDGNGFRIDHILGSKTLALRPYSCEYDLAVRSSRVSDHAPVAIEFIASAL